MKKLKALVVIAICLLSCVGITYAAHYNNIGYDFYHEGDTYNKIDGMIDPDNASGPINIGYYAPANENGVLNKCKYEKVSEETYENNKTHSFPVLEDREYIWGSPSTSWVYNDCEYPMFYEKGDNEGESIYQIANKEMFFMAFPLLDLKIECDKEELEEGQYATCEIILNSEINVYQIDFALHSEKLELKDVTVLNDKFIYNEETGEVSFYFGDYGYKPFEFTNEKIISFTVVGEKENKQTTLGTSNRQPDKKYTVELKDIIYRDKLVSDYEKENIVKTITLKGKELPVTPTTTKPTPTKPTTTKPVEKEEVENPKTGVEDHLVILSLVITATGIILYQLKDKNIFRKI